MNKKRPYLALVFDLKKTPNYNTNSLDGKKFSHYSKEYDNKRWAFYCTCGQSTEYPIDSIKRSDVGDLMSDNQILCSSCSKIYDDLSEIKIIYSKSPEHNVVSKRYTVVEKEGFYALYSFSTSILVSVTTKKLLFKDSTLPALYFSKKNKAIKIKNKDKIITVPFRFLVKHCSKVLDNFSDNIFYNNIIEHGLFERQIVNPILKFIKAIESNCDQRDVDRIVELLNKEREDVYYEAFYRDGYHNKINKNYYVSYKGSVSYESEQIKSCYDINFSTSRYIWFQYLKRRMCAMLIISAYPPAATIALSYGIENFLKLFYDSSMMCSLTNLIRKNPTNPKDIIETMFKRKITSEIAKNKKIEKYIKNEERKRKRRLKTNPNEDRLKHKITNHPIEFVDSRIPVRIKDLKKKTKAFNFKKSYMDLFIGVDFDKTSQMFCDFLGNNSIIDTLESVDKIIQKYDSKEVVGLIHHLCCDYSIKHNTRYDGIKITYDNLCHLMKLYKSDYVNFSRLLIVYMDTIVMLRTLNLPDSDIFKNKNSKSLEETHNHLVKSYQLILDKELAKKLEEHIQKYRHTEGVYNNIKFSLLDTPEKFNEESSFMNHCVKTYCKNVAEGRYIIYSIADLNTNDRATLSVTISTKIALSPYSKSEKKEETFHFNQLKSKYNSKSTERIINETKNFLEKFFKLTDIENNYDLKLEDKKETKFPDEEYVLLVNNEPDLNLPF